MLVKIHYGSTQVLVKGQEWVCPQIGPIKNHRQFHLKLSPNKDLSADTHS